MRRTTGGLTVKSTSINLTIESWYSSVKWYYSSDKLPVPTSYLYVVWYCTEYYYATTYVGRACKRAVRACVRACVHLPLYSCSTSIGYE